MIVVVLGRVKIVSPVSAPRIKLLPANSAYGEARSSTIIQEGRLLAQVRHPSVVTIYGAERIGDQVGLWMELVDGDTLERMLEQGRRFTMTEVVEIGIALCGAIAAVHEAGLLHRDIKCQNVMLARDGRVVLMDFGTGREQGDNSAAGLAGTPLYLAPELLSGQEPTVRSDIYSFGVLLYHLLTGSSRCERRVCAICASPMSVARERMSAPRGQASRRSSPESSSVRSTRYPSAVIKVSMRCFRIW